MQLGKYLNPGNVLLGIGALGLATAACGQPAQKDFKEPTRQAYEIQATATPYPIATAAPPPTSTPKPTATPAPLTYRQTRIAIPVFDGMPRISFPDWWPVTIEARKFPDWLPPREETRGPYVQRAYHLADMLEKLVQADYSWCFDCDTSYLSSIPAETQRDALAYLLYSQPGRIRGDPTLRGRELRWEQLLYFVLHPSLEDASTDAQHFPDNSIATMHLNARLNPSYIPGLGRYAAPSQAIPPEQLEPVARSVFKTHRVVKRRTGSSDDGGWIEIASQLPDGTLMRLSFSNNRYAGGTTVDINLRTWNPADLEYPIARERILRD